MAPPLHAGVPAATHQVKLVAVSKWFDKKKQKHMGLCSDVYSLELWRGVRPGTKHLCRDNVLNEYTKN